MSEPSVMSFLYENAYDVMLTTSQILHLAGFGKVIFENLRR